MHKSAVHHLSTGSRQVLHGSLYAHRNPVGGGGRQRSSPDAHKLVLKRAASAAQPASTLPMQKITSICQILDQFQGVLLDQFGVLHDGQKPYPHAIEAVQQLHAAGKHVIVLSNSSRRSGGTIGKLASMGFREEWFAGAVTSGELTHRYLAGRPSLWWQALGRTCIHFTWSSRGAISLEGLGLQVVDDPSQADFILAHGTEAMALPGGGSKNLSLHEMQQLLQQCAQQARQLPMVVANPDLVTVDGPSLITMPGTLARYYSQRGGPVQLMGKPDPIIYTAARELSPGAAADPQQWLAIGDSIEHDIAGAVQAGMKTLFIVGGIHGDAAGLQGSPAEGCSSSWDDAALQQLCKQHHLSPDYCMAYLQKAVQAGMKTLFIVGGIHGDAAGLQGSPAEGCSSSWDDAALQQLLKQHRLSPDYCMAYLQKAVQAGMKTLFIVGGIHGDAAGLQGSPAEGCSSSWDDAALQQLLKQHRLSPDYCMAYLQK